MKKKLEETFYLLTLYINQQKTLKLNHYVIIVQIFLSPILLLILKKIVEIKEIMFQDLQKYKAAITVIIFTFIIMLNFKIIQKNAQENQVLFIILPISL